MHWKQATALFDTAASYENEAAIGQALRSSGLPREEWFVTTKLWVQDTGYDSTLRAFDSSLKELGLDYIDLYLIHQPFGDYYRAWRAMERLYQEGAIRAIGVSNFPPERLVDLCMNQEIKPMVNQIEIHPFFQQNTALRVMEDCGIWPSGISNSVTKIWRRSPSWTSATVRSWTTAIPSLFKCSTR